MSAAPSPPPAAARRAAARAAVSAAIGAAALTLPACGPLPRPQAAAPEAIASTPPQLALWAPGPQALSGGFGAAYFGTDRRAYATAFEVDRTGRVRVVFPASPRDDGRVEPGRLYVVAGRGVSNDRAFVTAATNWARLPFLFVVVSDARPDLSDFGTGRSWEHQLRADAVHAEDVIADVSARVLAGSLRPASTDFAYLGPRLSVGEAAVVARCAQPALDRRDYWYFRDLWAVFTPADPTLGFPLLWGYGSLGLGGLGGAPFAFSAMGRLQHATRAFAGFCGAPPAGEYRPLYQTLAWHVLAGGDPGGTPVVGPPAPPVAPADSARPDSARPQPPAGARPTEFRPPSIPTGDAPAPVVAAAATAAERLAARLADAEATSAAAARRSGLAVEPLDPLAARAGVAGGMPGLVPVRRACCRSSAPTWSGAGSAATSAAPCIRARRTRRRSRGGVPTPTGRGARAGRPAPRRRRPRRRPAPTPPPRRRLPSARRREPPAAPPPRRAGRRASRSNGRRRPRGGFAVGPAGAARFRRRSDLRAPAPARASAARGPASPAPPVRCSSTISGISASSPTSITASRRSPTA
jgi:hypothetical protein